MSGSGFCCRPLLLLRVGKAFPDQNFTNVTGTVYLVHKVGRDMRRPHTGAERYADHSDLPDGCRRALS
jgi:hypothetical protein